MNSPNIGPSLLMFFSLAACPVPGQSLTLDRLELHSVKAEMVTHRGRTAVRITDADSSGRDDVSSIAIVRGTSFQDGTILVALTGDTVPGAPANLRGFVGIAFRVAGAGSQYECFYLRPKNGRSEDQLQRNHSAQYISVPRPRGSRATQISPVRRQSGEQRDEPPTAQQGYHLAA
jgi:hypothetical protein